MCVVNFVHTMCNVMWCMLCAIPSQMIINVDFVFTVDWSYTVCAGPLFDCLPQSLSTETLFYVRILDRLMWGKLENLTHFVFVSATELLFSILRKILLFYLIILIKAKN